jgi:hypothetical protein
MDNMVIRVYLRLSEVNMAMREKHGNERITQALMGQYCIQRLGRKRRLSEYNIPWNSKDIMDVRQ